jgi:hypothetical protein
MSRGGTIYVVCVYRNDERGSCSFCGVGRKDDDPGGEGGIEGGGGGIRGGRGEEEEEGGGEKAGGGGCGGGDDNLAGFFGEACTIEYCLREGGREGGEEVQIKKCGYLKNGSNSSSSSSSSSSRRLISLWVDLL